MFLDYVHCLTAVRSIKYDGFSLQLFQDSAQRLANQCMIVDNKNFHKKLSVIPLHGDPIEKNHTPTFGSLARKRPAEDWLPKPSILHPWPNQRFTVRQGRSRMPLCAVIVITSQYDTEKASADHESRGTQSLLRLCAMVKCP